MYYYFKNSFQSLLSQSEEFLYTSLSESRKQSPGRAYVTCLNADDDLKKVLNQLTRLFLHTWNLKIPHTNFWKELLVIYNVISL